MKTAVVTLVSGEFFEQLFQVSGPLIDLYAKKIGAEFVVDRSGGTPGYAKLKVIGGLLKRFDRVLYLDADILIRHDAPNLFDLVPEDAFGAFDESRLGDRVTPKKDWERQTGLMYPRWINDPKYFNTGVMVVGKQHTKLFAPAPVEIDNFYEQTYLNFCLFDSKVKTFSLPVDFNRILPAISATGRQLDDCYFSHFAGAFKNGSPVEENLNQFSAQAARFEQYSAVGLPPLPRRVFIETAGALGDVVSHEPLVRYIREILFPEAEITISTLWPEVFNHIIRVWPGSTKLLTGGKTLPDIGYLKISLVPKTATLPYNQMHALDFASIHGINGILPNEYRRIKLDAVPCLVDVKGHVLVHAGKSWQSKTFPKTWWDKVLDGLKQNGFKVALIGKDIDDGKGTVDVEKAGCLDLRNKLSTVELFGAIADAPILISNDSAPVHIAGAFNNHVILMPTCKHADYLVPHRAPELTHVLGRALQFGPRCGEANDVNMDVCTDAELLSALPAPGDVVMKAIHLRRENKSWT